MRLKVFQSIDNEAVDSSIIRKDFLIVCHQQAGNINDSYQHIEFMFGEKNYYYQIGNAYLQYEAKILKDVAVGASRVLVDVDALRLVNNALAYCFEEAHLNTTGGSDIELNKYVGQVSTIMRALTGKDRELLCHFDKIDESKAEIESTALHHHLINNHHVAAKKSKIKGHLPVEHIFGFSRTFKIFTS